jgi:hypothetical protein
VYFGGIIPPSWKESLASNMPVFFFGVDQAWEKPREQRTEIMVKETTRIRDDFDMRTSWVDLPFILP